MRNLVLYSLVTVLMGVSASAAFAAPAIWKASDDDSQVWLFGSVHLLPEETQWKSEALTHVLDTADVFYYEAPTDKSALVKLGSLIARYGLNLDGKQLTDYLTEEETELLKEVLGEMKVPLARLQAFKPWMAGITLEGLHLMKSGYQPDEGIEASLQPLTPDEQERFFETVEEQIGFLAGLDTETSVDSLVAGLHQIQEQPKLFDKLVAAWAAGDVAELSALFHAAMKESGPEVFAALITNRNEAWVDEILTLMEGDTDALIVVGAGHLVGEVGVPTLLEEAGITVERVQ